MRRLLVLGTHHFAPEVLDLASEIDDVRVEGFVENLDPERARGLLEELPVHWIDELAALAPGRVGVCALGTTTRRRFVEEAAARGLPFTTLVHPGARVSRRAALGPGCIVSAGAVVSTHASIGAHVILNRGALVGHDVVIGDYVTVGPGANIAGFATIGEQASVAMGAIVCDRVRVGRGAVVSAGAVVTREVPDGAHVAGVPARVLRRDVEPR